MQRAIELWTEATELGSVEALHSFGVVYRYGEGIRHVKAKGIQLLEKAAMQGHVVSMVSFCCSVEREERAFVRTNV